jgi:hypothetical protein
VRLVDDLRRDLMQHFASEDGTEVLDVPFARG